MAKTTSETSDETWLDSLDPATTPARDGRHLREIGRALARSSKPMPTCTKRLSRRERPATVILIGRTPADLTATSRSTIHARRRREADRAVR